MNGFNINFKLIVTVDIAKLKRTKIIFLSLFIKIYRHFLADMP